MAELDRIRAALGDRYMVERQIGRGAIATVYQVRDLKHGRTLAVKVLRPELAASIGPERFAREIAIAAQLQHPNIVPLYESGQAGDLLYYSMPYVEGESLRDRLAREGRLPVDEALAVACQVADALAYAHELGFVHRDIKPANVLLHHGQAVVADFGIARAVTAAGGPRLTTTGLVVGTPAYMSPEQASADEEVDGRSDIYSLGCVLFECLAGRLPFQGSSPRAVVTQHVTAPAPRIREIRSEVPKHVEGAILRALAKEPDDRFATVKDFADVLRDPTGVGRTVLAGRGRRAGLGWGRIAAALALAGVVGLGISFWPSETTLAGPGGGPGEGRAPSQVDSAEAEATSEAPDRDPEPTDAEPAEENDRALADPNANRAPSVVQPEGPSNDSAAGAADSARAAMERARDRLPATAGTRTGSVSYDDAVDAEAVGRRRLAAGAPDSARISFERAEALYDRAATEIEDLRAAADRARQAADQSMARVDSVGRMGAEYEGASMLGARADSAYEASDYEAARTLYERASDLYSVIPIDPNQTTREALMAAVRQYEESVEGRDIDGLRAVFPIDEDVWTSFFEIARDIDVQIEVESLEPERPNPTLDLRVTTRYVDNRNRDQGRMNLVSWIFEQSDGRWVVSRMVPRDP